MSKPKIAILTGAGISAESGIPTFRDADGLWEGHDVTKVASPQGWDADPELVLEFYNQRRKAALTAAPNQGHEILASLEQWFDVTIITQNVDNLHEKAGSSNILHLHGELFKSRSTTDPSLIYQILGWELKLGDYCEKGSQLRPHIVWFGEQVPNMEPAITATTQAEIFIVVGTSLVVYPAAGLLNMVGPEIHKFIVDPNMPTVVEAENIHLIHRNGSEGLDEVRQMLLDHYGFRNK